MRRLAPVVLSIALVPCGWGQEPAPDLRESGAVVGSIRGGFFGPLDDDRDVDAASLGFEWGHVFRDDLAWVLAVGPHVLDGETSNLGPAREVDTVGLGGALLLRWRFAGGGRWGAHFDYGLGLLATDEAFPPGGTSLNGTRQVGVGMTYRASPGVDLVAGARQLHVSNGRGLVADNPSYDGVGVYAGVDFVLGRRAVRRPIGGPDTRAPRPGPAVWSARFEAVGGETDDEGYGGGAALVDVPVTRASSVQVEVLANEIAGTTFSEAAAGWTLRDDGGRTALIYARQDLDVFSTDQIAAQTERFLHDLATFVGVVGFEDRNLADDRWLAGAFLRLHPHERFLFQSGPAFLGPLDGSTDAGDIELALRFEVAPAFLPDGLSVYLEDRPSETRQVGLLYELGTGGSLVERTRRGGLRRVRF